MTRTIVVSIILIMQGSGCWAYESPLDRAQQDLKEAEESCLMEGRDFRLIAKPILTVDLGGTTEPEAILDYGALECVGDSWLYSGAGGTTFNIYYSSEVVGYMSHTGYEIVPFEGHKAAKFKMRDSLSADACPRNCWRYVFFDGNKLRELYKK